jgi:hypothetical protein
LGKSERQREEKRRRRKEGELGRFPMGEMCIFMFFVLQGDEGRGRA